jgi:hypothetical protein
MITSLTLLAATAAPMPSVNDTTIAIDRTTRGFSIYTPVDGANGKYAIWNLDTQGIPGMGIMKEAEVRSFQGYDDRNATTAGAWYPYALKGMYGDRVMWSKSPGAYIEFQLESEPGQVVGLINFKNTNGGIGAVTIDGQASLANLLPEQNGSRVVDFYSANGATPNLFKNTRSAIPVADSLPGGTHTMRVYFTGTKNPSSSDTRILIDGLAVYNREATIDETVARDFLVLSSMPLTAGGAWESVFKVGAKFYGTNQHGNEQLLSAAIIASESPLEMAVYDTITTQNFGFAQTSSVAVDNVGQAAYNWREYKFTSEGMEVKLGTQWTRSFPMTHVYTAMWPVLDGPSISSVAHIDAYNTASISRTRFDVSRNDLFFKGGFDARCTYLYNEQNARTFAFEVTDLDNTADNPKFWVWDLGAPAYNKLYFQRQSDRYRPRVGETWRTSVKYRYYYDPSRLQAGF